MSDVDSVVDAEAIQKIAATELATSMAARQNILEEHSASFRWLMASMLAINGGGLVTLADQAHIDVAWRAFASFSFYVGIVSALAVAWLGQKSSRKMLFPFADLIGFWSLVSSTGHFDESEHAKIGQKIELAMQGAYRSQLAGWLSVVAFSGGLFCLIWGGLISGVEPHTAHDGINCRQVVHATANSNDR